MFRFLFIAGVALLVINISVIRSYSQTSVYHRYIVAFTDKDNSPYSIDQPSAYLSQRAIDRRSRYNIPITVTDLPVNPSYVEAITINGVKVLNKSKWLNSVSIYTEDSLALLAISALPFVKSANGAALRKEQTSAAQHKKMMESPELRVEHDEVYGLENFGTAAHQINMLEGNVLHENGYRGEGMIIALLDGGWYNTDVLDAFDSLFLEDRMLGSWNFVSGNDTIYSFSTHGTTVLSAIAANEPGKMIGTAPEAGFYLFISEDVFSEYPIEEHNWAAAAERADSLGADIISSSLGYSLFDDPSFNYTYADMDGKTTMISRAATVASRTGMIVSTSAGNSGQSPWYYVTAPADADSILSVGATDSTGTITAFSGHGPSLDGRVKPDVVAQGIRVWVIDPSPENDTTFPGNGTSLSNPIIAGLAACLWQAHPDKNNIEVMDAIRKSASFYNNPNDSMGFGIPNFQFADLILSDQAPADPDQSTFTLYPNPFSESLGILYYESSTTWIPVTLEVFDMLGRVVTALQATLQTGYNYLPIDALEHAANGAYFIRVNFDDHSVILRAVKGN